MEWNKNVDDLEKPNVWKFLKPCLRILINTAPELYNNFQNMKKIKFNRFSRGIAMAGLLHDLFMKHQSYVSAI